jgi:hypothetical protein
MSPPRWTSKSLRTRAKALEEQGHQISQQILRRLLREAGYSLQANAKTMQGDQHPDCDAQFRLMRPFEHPPCAVAFVDRPPSRWRIRDRHVARGVSGSLSTVGATTGARCTGSPLSSEPVDRSYECSTRPSVAAYEKPGPIGRSNGTSGPQ